MRPSELSASRNLRSTGICLQFSAPSRAEIEGREFANSDFWSDLWDSSRASLIAENRYFSAVRKSDLGPGRRHGAAECRRQDGSKSDEQFNTGRGHVDRQDANGRSIYEGLADHT